MADAVGLVASILQLVDTIAKARSYLKDFRNASKDQLSLLLELQSLESLVREVDERIKKATLGTDLRSSRNHWFSWRG
jgi:hypothetical protein